MTGLYDDCVYVRRTSLRRFYGSCLFCYVAGSITYVESVPLGGSTPTLVVRNCEKPIAVPLGDPVSYNPRLANVRIDDSGATKAQAGRLSFPRPGLEIWVVRSN